MTKQTKAADRGGQAAHRNVRAGHTKNTTRRADPGSFVLPIDGRYRLTADDLSWRIERRKGKAWRPVAYYATLQAAANDLGGRMLRTSDVQSLADALAAVENVARTLTQALAPAGAVQPAVARPRFIK